MDFSVGHRMASHISIDAVAVLIKMKNYYNTL